MDCGTFGLLENTRGIGVTNADADGDVTASDHWQCVDAAGLCAAATFDREASPYLSGFAPPAIDDRSSHNGAVFQLALRHLLGVGNIINVARTCRWLHDAVHHRLVALHHVNVAMTRAVKIVQCERYALILSSVDRSDYFDKSAYIAACSPSILRALNSIIRCQRDWQPWLLRTFTMRMSGLGQSIVEADSRYAHLLRLKWLSVAETGTDRHGLSCVAVWDRCFSEARAWCEALDDVAARYKARRDLFVAELYAPAISVVAQPDKVIDAVAARLDALPRSYWPRVIDAAFSICANADAIYKRLENLPLSVACALPRMSPRTVAEMAVLKICAANAEDVRAHFVTSCGGDERYIADHIEPCMASILVQEALLPVRIRTSMVLHGTTSDAFASASMMCVDQWSILDPGLIACLHSAFITGVAQRVVLRISEWRSLPEERKEALRTNVFCMSASDVSNLGFDLHRFWTIYEEIQHADDRMDGLQMWLEIQAMPWQVQPTMVSHLLAATFGANVVGVKQGRALQPRVCAWAKEIIPQCLAAGYPLLADRALACVLKLIPLLVRESASGERVIARTLLRFALDVSRPIPVWASIELMEGIAGVLSVYENATSIEAPLSRVMNDRVTAFIRDKSVSLLYPSSHMLLFIIARSIGDWRALPESGMPVGRAFDAYFARFHVYNDKLQNIFTNLLRTTVAQDILNGTVDASEPDIRAWFGQGAEKERLLKEVFLLRAAHLSNEQQRLAVTAERGRGRRRKRHG